MKKLFLAFAVIFSVIINAQTAKEIIDKNTKYDDLITTAMRTREGIDTEKLKADFGNELYTYFMKEAAKHINNGTLQNVNGRVSLTRKGLFISDDIMSDLMHV